MMHRPVLFSSHTSSSQEGRSIRKPGNLCFIDGMKRQGGDFNSRVTRTTGFHHQRRCPLNHAGLSPPHRACSSQSLAKTLSQDRCIRCLAAILPCMPQIIFDIKPVLSVDQINANIKDAVPAAKKEMYLWQSHFSEQPVFLDNTPVYMAFSFLQLLYYQIP